MTSRWTKPSLRSPRIAGIGVVTALVAGTLGLAFGTGYVANQAVFSGTSAWLRSDGDDATLVSAAGGAPQDQIDTGAGEITTNPDGSLGFTSEPDAEGSKRIERYETAPAAGDDAPTGSATIDERATTVVADRHTWVIDPESSTISIRDPRTLAARGAPIRVESGVVGHALGTDGTLWVLDGKGRVARVDGRRLADRRALDLTEPSKARLAVAGEQPVVVDPTGGALLVVGGDTVAVPALRDARILLAPSQPGPWLVLVAGTGDQHRLVALDPTSGTADAADLGSEPVAAPLAVAVDAYVPTVVDGRQLLRRFALPDLTEARPVRLPATTDRGHRPADDDLGYDAFLVGNRIWANDPVSTQALTIGEQEEPSFVQKVDPDATGDDGDAVTDEEAEEPEAPSAPETPVTAPDLPPVPTPPVQPPAGGGATPTPGGGTRAPDPGPGVTTTTTSTTTPQVPPVAVPDLTGLDYEVACERLTQLRLRCLPDIQPDKDRTEGEVYEQDPASGEEVPVDSGVTLTYAVWGSVRVPDIAGLAPEAAQQALEEVGLEGVPTDRTDAAPTDLTFQVVEASVEPAAGTQLKVNDQVAYEYFSDYAPIPYNGDAVVGLAGDQACPALQQQGFFNCTPTADRPAPRRSEAGLVYQADPVTAENPQLKPNTPIVVHVNQAAAEAASPPFPGGCAEALNWAAGAGLQNVTCDDATPGTPSGPTPIGAIIAQNPAPGANIGSGDHIQVFPYRPALVPVYDWARTSSDGAAHILRGTNTPPEGTDWQQSGGYNFLAGAEPGAGQMTCWSMPYGSSGTLRYQCNLTGAAPTGYRGPWTQVDTAGAFFAWGADPGGARPLVSCELQRRRADGTGDVVFLAQYWSNGGCVTADPAGAPFVDVWQPTFTIWVAP